MAQDFLEERRRFEARMVERATAPSELICDREGAVMLAVSTLNGLDGAFETSSRLMLALGLAGKGRFVRAGDWGRVEGVFRPGTAALSLPDNEAEGCSPAARLLGFAISRQRADAALGDLGGVDALLPAATSLHVDPLLQSVLTALWRDAQLHGLSSAFFDHGVDLVLRHLVSRDRPKVKARRVRPLKPGQMQRLYDLVEARMASDLRVAELADEVGRDVRGVTRAFRDATGYAPFEYLTLRRMEHAKQLLKTDATIMEIALAVGYANPAKFAAAFRRVCGCAPSDWRQSIQ
ncbi:helix-turn-helix transcriptional regulator [Nitratireductor aquibiodomus]|uniref:helix-turn-helix transcriptional regulator n=1 Tax=Nitratireductor aquibiodomus TaxID=204799 RepID=UPI0012FDC3C1|nr:AraC family transcriptional regulator [Nitratireductor aquibiodomus]